MNSSDIVHEISHHIDANALKYFPELVGSDIKITLLEKQHRTFSSLYRFELTSTQGCYRIFAKGIPLARDPKPTESSQQLRARLAPPGTDFRERTWLEYTALNAIEHHFEELNNPALGAIHILDFIPNPQTIIMEEHSDPNLRFFFAKTHRLIHLRGKATNLLNAFFNAGAWLKSYSTISKTENVTTRHSHREEFKESVKSFADYLANASGDRPFFERVEKILITSAEEFLPELLPMGLGHGDYALRNILLGEDDRVTAMDTCAKWRVPIYEDIAYFLIRLEINRLQVLSLGLATHPGTVAAYQREFLAGYFGEEQVPTEAILLFQALFLMDSWASQLETYTKQKTGLKRVYHKLYLALLNRRYRSIMQRLLSKIALELASERSSARSGSGQKHRTS